MKLSLDALKERAEAVASNELMNGISGGVAAAEGGCHLTGILSVDVKIIAAKLGQTF